MDRNNLKDPRHEAFNYNIIALPLVGFFNETNLSWQLKHLFSITQNSGFFWRRVPGFFWGGDVRGFWGILVYFELSIRTIRTSSKSNISCKRTIIFNTNLLML